MRKVVDSRDAYVKWIYCDIVNYKVKLKHKIVLLNTLLCWLVIKILVQDRHKTKMSIPFKDVLRVEPPLPDI